MNIPTITFTFLKNLRENNNREWFNDNRDKFEREKETFIEFVQHVLGGLAKLDKRIPSDLPVSKCVFRIYRDIRFSKDKTPYKDYFSAGFSSTGKSTNLPGYYIHIQPGKSFVTAGLWHPEKEKLAAIRQEIDYNSDHFRKIINTPKFKKLVSLDQEDKLKKAPSGYSIDHPDI